MHIIDITIYNKNEVSTLGHNFQNSLMKLMYQWSWMEDTTDRHMQKAQSLLSVFVYYVDEVNKTNA